MYSRWFIERVPDKGGGGWKLHIEIHLPSAGDTIEVMNKYAKQINEEYEKDDRQRKTMSVNSSV